MAASRPLRRLAPILIGVAGALLLQQIYGTQPVELLFTILPSMDDGSGIEARITRRNESKLILQVTESLRANQGHTVVVRTKLARGGYHVQAWLQNAAHTPLVADFEVTGEEVVEVRLAPR